MWRWAVFPKVDACWRGRGLSQPPGLRPWAGRALSGTGWRFPDGFKAFGLGSYKATLRWRGRRPAGRHFICRFAALRISPPTGGIYTGAERRCTSPAERYYITTLGGALKLSGRRSRSRTEPLGPRANGPAAPSTLTPVRACQPSGIQVSAAVPFGVAYITSTEMSQCQGILIDRHHRLVYNYSVMVCEKWHCQHVRRCYSWQK